ncbi:SDR family NAD(P)-dependent oxidoreductase [Shimia marina]|uniref:Putative ketoacyl reductase n=1 Tax=Shimia marina TaxID=321267 RepID=A0A0P1EL44_9RHOB|nr:SDR family NAD(P)-dependent oxidoreductase [Shimia marina]CUH50955.1 Putative ketoacyl reductase [Shimia marina]SFD61746.1 Short-chain dehydrogenase [Shimia marina]
MSQKSLLITGCSSGIGLAAAQTMRDRGWRVFASCRSQKDCKRLIKQGFESPLIDYCAPDTIRSGLKDVLEATGGTLDALFNNGARGLPGAVEDLPAAGLRTLMESNLIGWHDLTQQVLPVMRQQGHGRIVNNSSVLGYVSLRYRGAYVASKHALEGWSDCLRLELRDTPLHVSLIQPGPITSAMRRNNATQFFHWIDWENSPHAEAYRTGLLKRFSQKNSSLDPFELPASAVCNKLIHALEAPRPRARYRVTKPAHFMNVLRRTLPTEILDWVIAKG